MAQAVSLLPDHPEFKNIAARFHQQAGTRAYVQINVTRISDSCGYSVPVYEFKHDRDVLDKWTTIKGDKGLKEYRNSKYPKYRWPSGPFLILYCQQLRPTISGFLYNNLTSVNMKQDYWDVSDEQVMEKTGKKITDWLSILDKLKASEKKSNDVVAHLQQEYNVPRYWARTLTHLYLKQQEE
jgi:hypothetical protein